MRMAIRQKVDMLAALKASGFTSYKLRKCRLLGEATMSKLRQGGLPSWGELDTICCLLNLQPGDLLEYVPDAEGEAGS